MRSIDLTRDGLVRALAAAVPHSPGVEAALARRAGEIATRAEAQGLEARTVRTGTGRHVVAISGAGLPGRAPGALDELAEETIARIVEGDAP